MHRDLKMLQTTWEHTCAPAKKAFLLGIGIADEVATSIASAGATDHGNGHPAEEAREKSGNDVTAASIASAA
jgi:hypothetical protein